MLLECNSIVGASVSDVGETSRCSDVLIVDVDRRGCGVEVRTSGLRTGSLVGRGGLSEIVCTFRSLSHELGCDERDKVREVRFVETLPPLR